MQIGYKMWTADSVQIQRLEDRKSCWELKKKIPEAGTTESVLEWGWASEKFEHHVQNWGGLGGGGGEGVGFMLPWENVNSEMAWNALKDLQISCYCESFDLPKLLISFLSSMTDEWPPPPPFAPVPLLSPLTND